MQIKSYQKTPLIELLSSLSPKSSKNTLRSWVKKGRVFINDRLAKGPTQEVNAGQEVRVISKPKFLLRGLKIIYEDDSLVVVEKPAGLLSVATEREEGTTVHDILKRRYNNRRVYPIHRLDRDTSGLLVFTYNSEVRDHLKKQLEQRSMSREYEALVHGHPGKGTWRCFLKENRQMIVFVCSSYQGKEAITHFETLKKQKDFSLLKLKLESGRKHQIRVQAAHAGFPIVGDGKYGIDEDKKKSFRLRAVYLSFFHPILKKVMKFKISS